MTTSSNHPPVVPGPGRSKVAFTLIELMIAIGLFGIVMAAILPTFMVFARHSTSLGNYAEMGMDSRYALEIVGRDLHGATSLTLAEEGQITLVLPADMGGSTVNYAYDSGLQTLTRTVTSGGSSKSRVLFDDVERFTFTIYNRLGNSLGKNASEWPSILNEAKSIQMDAVRERKLLSTKNTDYVISAKFMMRNI
ncbi:MAG: PilW family protein [Coraliomargarita sp.]